MGIVDDDGHFHVLLGYVRECPLPRSDQNTGTARNWRVAYHVDHLVVPSGQQVPAGRVPCLDIVSQ